MPDLKKMLTLEALSAALPSWLKRSTKPDYNADEIETTLTVNQFVTASDKQNWNAKGTYSKPSGGIPKSDLTNAVQTSLGKADTALQSFTETDPTVPSWAKQSSKPSYTQDEVSDGTTYKRVTSTEKNTWNSKGTYSKPSDGIPKTDLASAVQTSLGKADSALQSHQTIKQDGVTGATVNRFGTCGTAAATAAKTVSITTGTFTLEAGARVTVKFSNANTAGTPTLNVNSTGAKNIYSKGSQIKTGSNKSLLAGTVDFIYDGTQYHLIGNYIDTNTTYSSKSAASGGTDVSLCTTGEKYTWNSKGTYSKPSDGIPKSDLASAVQTSLGLADTALQSFTESDPTVPSWAKQSSKPSYSASEVGAVALTGNTITGDIQRKQTEIDASKANNNISATKYPTTYSIIDNSGRIMVRNEAIVEPSGNISWYAYVRNYNTSGGQVAQKGIKYTVNKSGAGTWTVDDATSFKSAIGLADLSKLFSPTYVQPTKHSNITSIDSGGYIQIGKLTILNMRFTVGTACGQYTDIFTDLPLPLTPLSGGSACVACSSNNNTLMICANGRLQNYDSGSLAPGVYVVSACYMTQ